jgi:hypothetical protein
VGEFMGRFSYGIEFWDKYYRDFIGLLFSALWDVPSIEKQFPRINEFFTSDYDILEYKLKWVEQAQQFDLFREFINEYWKKAGSEVFLDIFMDNSGVPNPCVCIRDTLKVTDRPGFNEYCINLDKIDIALWDSQLKEKCKRIGISWESPAFRLVLYSQKDDLVSDLHSEFFYGIPIDKQSVTLSIAIDQLLKSYSDAQASVERKNQEQMEKEPTCFLVFNGEDGHIFYLSIRNAVKKQYLEKGTWAFEVIGLDTSIWDSLLKTKFDQYKISWRKPSFCLNLFRT